MSYDTSVRATLRWVAGEVADDVQVASTWALALQLAGVGRPQVAILDFDRVSPQGRVQLANLLRLRYATVVLVVGNDASLDDATRHGISTGFAKPIDTTRLMSTVARIVGLTFGTEE
jgi:DNA-binding NtrC family response regulator